MKGILTYLKFLLLPALISGVINFSLFATHNRAGEITLRQINDLTYEITITTYTYTLSGADRPELEVQWGDNTTSVAPRLLIVNLPNDYRRNVYITQHTFPGSGIYTIVVQDPNRNFGVLNIPNSVNVIFSIKTTISINPQIGRNSTPVLLNPPFDKAGLYQIFIHNPGAFDPDGDSISYSLTVCTQQNGEPIPGYTLPKASIKLSVDSITGDLVWDSPQDTGIYNIAMNISEWRKGIKIGNIVRDMQVEVYRTTNLPPVNDSLPKLCVIAGSSISYDIRSTDANLDNLKHFITGGPFIISNNPAATSLKKDIPGEIVTRFTWQTSCEQVRVQPYSILVKTNDVNYKLSLVDIDNLEINVLGPPPHNIDLIPGSSQVLVQWKVGECDNIVQYHIYRKTNSSGYVPDSCTYGIPAFTGFKLIGHTQSNKDSIYIDNNNGKGLQQGTEYCYRIVAVYPDGAESIPSTEVCTILIPGSPSILNTSVTKTGSNTGEVFLSWAKPLHLDTIPANGPYEYIVYRSDNLFGLKLSEIYRFSTSNLNDTVYTDKNLNTIRFPYSYSVELYNIAPRFLIGKPEIASTLYPDISEAGNTIGLKFVKNVPWINNENTINRYNNTLGKFDSISVTEKDFYSDKNLTNGEKYCYQIKAKGFRKINGIDYSIQNFSHVNCGTPIDTVAPCPPILFVSSICDSFFNHLSWINKSDTCSEDIVKYNIYYIPDNNSALKLIESTTNKFYNHFPESCLDGCYYVSAVDSFGNESSNKTLSCAKECYYYDLPNVFSPDGDGINDILHPSLYLPCIDRIDLKIFNRWGQLVFQTGVPEINWNGKIQNSNKVASTGVYYYSCDIYKSSERDPINKVGFIHVYSDKNSKNTE